MIAVSAWDAGLNSYSVSDCDILHGRSDFDNGTCMIRKVFLDELRVLSLTRRLVAKHYGASENEVSYSAWIQDIRQFANGYLSEPSPISDLSASSAPTRSDQHRNLGPEHIRTCCSHQNHRYPFVEFGRGHRENRVASEWVDLRMRRL